MTVNLSSLTLFVKNIADLHFLTQQYFTKNVHSLNLKFFTEACFIKKRLPFQMGTSREKVTPERLVYERCYNSLPFFGQKNKMDFDV